MPNKKQPTTLAFTSGVVGFYFRKRVHGLSSLREQLKANKPAGVADGQIDELINQF